MRAVITACRHDGHPSAGRGRSHAGPARRHIRRRDRPDARLATWAACSMRRRQMLIAAMSADRRHSRMTCTRCRWSMASVETALWIHRAWHCAMLPRASSIRRRAGLGFFRGFAAVGFIRYSRRSRLRRPGGLPFPLRERLMPLLNDTLGSPNIGRVIGIISAPRLVAGLLQLDEFSAHLRACHGAARLLRECHGRDGQERCRDCCMDQRFNDDDLHDFALPASNTAPEAETRPREVLAVGAVLR